MTEGWKETDRIAAKDGEGKTVTIIELSDVLSGDAAGLSHYELEDGRTVSPLGYGAYRVDEDMTELQADWQGGDRPTKDATGL